MPRDVGFGRTSSTKIIPPVSSVIFCKFVSIDLIVFPLHGDPKAVGVVVLGRSARSHAPGGSLWPSLVNKDRPSGVVCDLASSSR